MEFVKSDAERTEVFARCGIDVTAVHPGVLSGGAWGDDTVENPEDLIESRDPATGELLACVLSAPEGSVEGCIKDSMETWLRWRELPAPRRGDIIRKIADALRHSKADLATIISLEVGKILQESLGEVQEAIDIADFAAGQSRMLYGLAMNSERPEHAMRELWHPLGIVGVITAFNFPMAVWAWNAMMAFVCGDAVLWKPSSRTPLSAIAIANIVRPILAAEGFEPLLSVVLGSHSNVGQSILTDTRIPLVSFTGSTAVGRTVAKSVASRFGRTILELGGNNAVIVMDDADLSMAVRSIVFGATGTCGQRCTSTRRVLVHRSVAYPLEQRLIAAYRQVKVGNPLNRSTLCGPLISSKAVDDMQAALERIRSEGGEILFGGEVLKLEGADAGGNYVQPCIVRAKNEFAIVREETFAPILYIIEVDSIDDAIAKHNDVPQGLSSAIFTLNVRHAERFLSSAGSDCGIANVNIGTSGAEIGAAFGGEKQTGGGREAGSDAWKGYMRRQSATVNWSTSLPLAQGIQFG